MSMNRNNNSTRNQNKHPCSIRFLFLFLCLCIFFRHNNLPSCHRNNSLLSYHPSYHRNLFLCRQCIHSRRNSSDNNLSFLPSCLHNIRLCLLSCRRNNHYLSLCLLSCRRNNRYLSLCLLSCLRNILLSLLSCLRNIRLSFRPFCRRSSSRLSQEWWRI